MLCTYSRRIVQFAGGFDVDTMRAFQELKEKASMCRIQRQPHSRGSSPGPDDPAIMWGSSSVSYHTPSVVKIVDCFDLCL
jgi:hypothetical protein